MNLLSSTSLSYFLSFDPLCAYWIDMTQEHEHGVKTHISNCFWIREQHDTTGLERIRTKLFNTNQIEHSA